MSKVENIKKVIDEIDSIILELKKKKITKEDAIENYFWDNHPKIMNTYPFLVVQIASGTDRTMLDYMLKTLNDIEDGKVEQEQADVDVGQKIVDDLIKPNLK